MSIAAVYNNEGLITKVLDMSPESIALNLAEGEGSIVVDEEFSFEDWWVFEGVLRPKTDFPTPQTRVETISGGFRITIWSIPVGTLVRWPDNFLEVELEGVLTLVVNIPGEYQFSFAHYKFFDREVIIDVQ